MIERWRPAPGFEGLYEVSDLGRVASLPKKTWHGRRILSAAAHARGGYLYVTLHKSGVGHHRKVHHLVCEAFNGARPESASMVRHLDGDHLNNTPANLTWGTGGENNLDTVRHGRHHNANKDRCKNDHPLTGSNLYINKTSGARQCRICQNRAKRAWAKRQKETAR